MNLSIAITAMVNHTALQGQPNVTINSQDDWNATREESQAIVSLVRQRALSLIHNNLMERIVL